MCTYLNKGEIWKMEELQLENIIIGEIQRKQMECMNKV